MEVKKRCEAHQGPLPFLGTWQSWDHALPARLSSLLCRLQKREQADEGRWVRFTKK